jgi:cell division protein FtsB
MQRWLLIVLALLFVLLQYRLWIGDNSLAERTRLQNAIEQQERENQRLEDRNAIVEREVDALKSGDEEIEARAREDLGLIKDGETFYLFPSEPTTDQQSEQQQEP